MGIIKLEVCIDTPDAIATSVAEGVDRIELCSALSVGGLTPSRGMMALAAQSTVPVHAMIRPTTGGFVISDAAFEVMMTDIAAARDYGLAGVVLGILSADCKLDHKLLAKFIATAGPLEVTLHRAIDLCLDPLDAVDVAADLGITRILTSGTAKNAFAGRNMIRQMVDRAADRLTIMPGSGVTAANVRQLVQETGVRDVHASCATTIPEAEDVAEFGFGNTHKRVTDSETIRAMRLALDGL